MKNGLIALSVATLLLVGCSDNKQNSNTAQNTPTQNVIKEEVKKSATEIKDEAKTVVNEAKDAVTNIKEELETKVQEAQNSQVASDIKDDASKVIQDVSSKAQEIKDEATSSLDGAKLFVSCAGCHGTNAQNAALGKSQIIKGWDEAKTLEALKGYKDGSYGGAMKGMMKSQVDNKSDEELEALAKYIANLK